MKEAQDKHVTTETHNSSASLELRGSTPPAHNESCVKQAHKTILVTVGVPRNPTMAVEHSSTAPPMSGSLAARLSNAPVSATLDSLSMTPPWTPNSQRHHWCRLCPHPLQWMWKRLLPCLVVEILGRTRPQYISTRHPDVRA